MTSDEIDLIRETIDYLYVNRSTKGDKLLNLLSLAIDAAIARQIFDKAKFNLPTDEEIDILWKGCISLEKKRKLPAHKLFAESLNNYLINKFTKEYK
jgi:6-pyruvoyl-tetrahydropterin synthase